MMSVLYNDGQQGSIKSQEYKSFEINDVTIKISMTKYHHWILNSLIHHLFYHYSLSGEMSMIFLVTCIFLLFWNN